MLLWHDHDIEQALSDMKNFVPSPDGWSNEDKILFEQAHLFHGKNFNKIRTVVSNDRYHYHSESNKQFVFFKLPDKTQANLVNYYYMWKKTRNHKSLMDSLQNKKFFF